MRRLKLPDGAQRRLSHTVWVLALVGVLLHCGGSTGAPVSTGSPTLTTEVPPGPSNSGSSASARAFEIEFCGQVISSEETTVQCAVPSELEPLSRLPQLNHLILDLVPTDPQQLGGLTTLRVLSLRAAGISDLAPISNLTQLRDLDLSRNPISDVTALATLTQLVELDLTETEVTDVRPLTALVRLRRLSLSGAPVTNLRPLGSLASLEELDVSYTSLADTFALAPLSSLRHLDLSGTPVSNVAGLGQLEALVSVDISETRVRSVEPLSSLSQLRRLVADVAHLDARDLSALQRANAELEVVTPAPESGFGEEELDEGVY